VHESYEQCLKDAMRLRELDDSGSIYKITHEEAKADALLKVEELERKKSSRKKTS
jgi:hypothetical protein